MTEKTWRDVAQAQAGMISRRQLNEVGADRWHVRNNIAAQRWTARSPMVVSTTTGALSREQTMWLGILHAGPSAILGGLSAAEVGGLRNWARDDITVLIPDELEVEPVPGVDFHRTRRPIQQLRCPGDGLPRVGSNPRSCCSAPTRGRGALPKASWRRRSSRA